MRIHINPVDIHNDNLSWLCIEPMLISIRGKNLNDKTDLYHQLNEGQRALYLFYAFHNHAKSFTEFYWFAAYFMHELKAWKGLKEGMSFFKAQEILKLLEHLEFIIENKNIGADGSWREVSTSDLETDINLSEEIRLMYSQYQPLADKTIQDMNSYIRSNQEDFIN